MHRNSVEDRTRFELDAEVEALAALEISDSHGAIYTKPEVVDFILDLVGYTEEKNLGKLKLLEPSFGQGDFLLAAINRLLPSWRERGHGPNEFDCLRDAVRAFEIHRGTFNETSKRVNEAIVNHGLPSDVAEQLVDAWLVQGDFLTSKIESSFDIVVGNPPYVRQELIPKHLMRKYRALYKSIYDRADLYIPFFERSLDLLTRGGHLGFICSDRWMKNRYGGPLREIIASGFTLKYYIDMYSASAFREEVSAYPAITVIARESGGITRAARQVETDSKSLQALYGDISQETDVHSGMRVQILKNVFSGRDPLIVGKNDENALFRKLGERFPKLEETGCKVGIGVATGADEVFIQEYDTLDVERSRKLPILRTKDIRSGKISWCGSGVVNPYNTDGSLVSLQEFPRFRAFMERHRTRLSRRHCARTNPERWYKTIDRIHPDLLATEKLLIPDIKGRANIVLENGSYYPHHNLYYIVSKYWDLKALQAILMSDLVLTHIGLISTRMRGGYLRYQAQYLRRICLPDWRDVSIDMRGALSRSASTGDTGACNEITFELFKLTRNERRIVRDWASAYGN